jgi:hypothetical protein
LSLASDRRPHTNAPNVLRVLRCATRFVYLRKIVGCITVWIFWHFEVAISTHILDIFVTTQAGPEDLSVPNLAKNPVFEHKN